MSEVITPTDGNYMGDKPLVFLAGPCMGAPEWQDQAISDLMDLDIAIANPRRKIRFDSHDEDLYLGQINWESNHLRLAAQTGAIIFWLPLEAVNHPRRSYAQTTRFELAEWLTNQSNNPDIQLVIGIDDAFPGKRYIKTRSSVHIYDAFDQVIDKTRNIFGKI